MTNDDHPQQGHDQGHDPVNRWATEHYGFDDTDNDRPVGHDIAPPRTTAGLPASTGPDQAAPAGTPGSGRRTGLVVGGIVSLALVLGLGGVSVAVAADDGGRGGEGDGGRGSVVQVDRFDQANPFGDGGRFDGGRR